MAETEAWEVTETERPEAFGVGLAAEVVASEGAASSLRGVQEEVADC